MSVLRPSETSNVIKIVSSRKRRRSSNDAADRYSNQAAKDAKTEGGGGGGGSGRGRGKAGVMRARQTYHKKLNRTCKGRATRWRA